jgi:hypothetical protein
MKLTLLPFLSLLSACAIQALEPPAAPAYVSEAPLPEGWPQPGPYDQVSAKSYPAYRAAFTNNKWQNLGFWTLFGHIKRNNIPMTSPVEITMDKEGEEMAMSSMAFLYRNDKVGAVGADGKKVEVRDVPAAKVLSYTWQGDDTKANVAKAKTAIKAALTERKLSSKQFRLLGYNGPATPRDKATWELQAVLDEAD